MRLASLAPVIYPMRSDLPLTFAEYLYACAIYQQVQVSPARVRRDSHIQGLLASGQSAAVGHIPVQLCQFEQTLCQARALAQAQAGRALHDQTNLNGRVVEDRRLPGTPAERSS